MNLIKNNISVLCNVFEKPFEVQRLPHIAKISDFLMAQAWKIRIFAGEKLVFYVQDD